MNSSMKLSLHGHCLENTWSWAIVTVIAAFNTPYIFYEVLWEPGTLHSTSRQSVEYSGDSTLNVCSSGAVIPLDLDFQHPRTIIVP